MNRIKEYLDKNPVKEKWKIITLNLLFLGFGIGSWVERDKVGGAVSVSLLCTGLVVVLVLMFNTQEAGPLNRLGHGIVAASMLTILACVNVVWNIARPLFYRS